MAVIMGDAQAEKRSYDEHGNQARIYASRPGHSAVANVGLKGVFLKDGPSYDELVLQVCGKPARLHHSSSQLITSHHEAWHMVADDYATSPHKCILPFPALPCPSLPFPALPCPPLPSPALPCPSLPVPALRWPDLIR